MMPLLTELGFLFWFWFYKDVAPTALLIHLFAFASLRRDKAAVADYGTVRTR
jgi:hypothetical protein